jgi:GNAT superfamily N-acetyltransferase
MKLFLHQNNLNRYFLGSLQRGLLFLIQETDTICKINLLWRSFNDSYSTIPEDMEKRMSLIESTNNYYTFVAMISGVVVGMIGIRMQLSYVSEYLKTQVSALVTKEEFQGKGVGRALLEHVEQWVQEMGSNFIYLTSGIKDS